MPVAQLRAISGGRSGPITAERIVTAAAVGVGAALWWPVLAPPEARAPAAPSVPWTRDVALARLAEKPLFTASRRFPLAPIQPDERTIDPGVRSMETTHHLKGVARTQDDAIAFIEDRETQQVAVLRAGGVIEGFAVTGIGAAEVVLRGPDGTSVTLRAEDP